MSLGVKSIWRARIDVRRLSLIPRAHPIPGFSRAAASSPHMRLLSSQSLDNEPVAGAASRDGNPSPSKSVVSPVALVDRLVSLPVRQHGARESVLVEPRIEYPHRRETRRSERRNHQGITAQLRLDRIREAQRALPPNWRAVLHTLTVWTPKYSEDTVEVVLPEDAADLLQSDAEENIWDIQSRTGVSIKLDSGAGDNGQRSLFLSGDRRGIDKAVEDIVNVTKKVTRVLLSRDGSPITLGEDRSRPDDQKPRSTPPVPIWETRPQLVKPYTLTARAEDIPRPDTWTRTSFEEYIIALTMGRLPPTLASSIYPKDMSHDEAVIMQLHQAFNDPTAQQALSSSAFKLALAFMARKGHTFRPHARALFVRMEMFGMRTDTEVFNLLAESSVKARDLRSFSTAISLMVKRGHRPNLRTWVLFLRLIKSEEVKRYILHAMNHTGLLNSPSTVKAIAKEMASHDIDRAIQQGKDLKTFLADQDSLYGPDWLSRDAGNKIIETLGRHGRFDDCGTFLDIMARNASTQPDTVTLNTVITHCKVQNNLHKAIDMLERFDGKSSAAPDAVTYHLLSELGWRHKSPHVTGLVWRYSCLTNRTSYRMRKRAARLLRKGAAANPARGIGEGGEEEAAAAAATRGMESLFISEVTSDAEAAISSSNPASGADAMQQMMQWYKHRHRDWEPAAPLSGLLREALARDTWLHRELKEGRVAAVTPVALPTRRRAVVAGRGRGR